MNDSEFQLAYEEENRRDYITNATIATVIQIPLNLFCSVMDFVVYPDKWSIFLKARVCSVLLVVLAWVFYKIPRGDSPRRLGVVWIMSPLVMILWMIYAANAPLSPYYAGLNIILLGMGLLTPWAFRQNLLVAIFVVVMYVLVSLGMQTKQPISSIINNTTFLILTAVIVVVSSRTSARQRHREFTLRWELERKRQQIEESNRRLAAQNTVLENTLVQLKETELQLVQSEKIASLGRLSAGIIHEINNPINFATTGIYVLRKQGQALARESPEEFSEVLNDVDEGLQRVKNIVSDLRTFTHPDSVLRDPVKLADVINASLRFLSNEWKDKVQIEQTVAADLVCLANKNKLTQVFVNLIQNALDALKNKAPGPDAAHIRIAGQKVDRKIIITVRDNGEGIESPNLARIFDPFFTTRDVGKGMGMGLSICYRILQELEGSISVSSERGKYCEFKIELPAVEAQPLEV
jgi:two-component system sensor histidine kinase PhcS